MSETSTGQTLSSHQALLYLSRNGAYTVRFVQFRLKPHAKYGKLNIFNTEQGSQFANAAFADVLQENGIQISTDGQGRYLDNVFFERR